jgi:hypothetical protein
MGLQVGYYSATGGEIPMIKKEEIAAILPSIREALDQLAFQTGIPYVLGNAQGGIILLYEFCTFTTPNHEPLTLGVMLCKKDSKLELTLELAEVVSGYYSYWKVCLGEPPEGGIHKLVEVVIENLPKVSVIKKILIPEPKPEPLNSKQVLAELVRKIHQGEVTLQRGVELVEEALESTVKKALATQARNIVGYLEKYTG